MSATDATGTVIPFGVTDDLSRPIFRALMKVDEFDPDDLDGVPNGSTYAKIRSDRLTAGVLKRTGALDDGSYAAKASDTAGETLSSTVKDTAGRLISKVLVKVNAADPDTLDSVPDGSTHARMLADRLAAGVLKRAGTLDDGGHAARAVDSGGAQLHESVSQQSGGTAKNLAVGRYAISTGTHGQSVSFPSNYQNPPAVNILGGISYEPASVWSTDPNSLPGALAPAAARQIDEVAAYNVTTSGASLRARLRQASTSTARSDAYASGAITTDGGNKEATTANAPANNDSYTSDYTYTFEISGVPGKTGSISATVCLDYWNGSSWIQAASATYADSDTDGDGSVILTGSDTLAAVVSGLTSSSKFRIRLVVNAAGGNGTRTYSVDPGNCDYTTTAGDQYASKTPGSLGITLSVEVIGAS